MIEILKRMILGPKPVRRPHPDFGQIAFVKVKSGGYWESEPSVEGKVVCVVIEAGLEGPSGSQAEFFRHIASSIDATFAQVAILLVSEYEKWADQPFPEDWREAFQLAGLTIPKDGNTLHLWDISFECLDDGIGHHFTAYFEDGRPAYVTVEG